MKPLTKEELDKTGFQKSFQFGTRVETPCGKKGIVNFFSENMDLCRVYYDTEKKTKSIMVKISKCRVLSLDEAVGI
jgi:hypothetical protein